MPDHPPPPRPASVTDVALHAGVSRATVSRVLRRMDNVSPQTVERVLASAKALDYTPNPLMQTLLTGVRRQRPERRSNLAWILNYDPVATGKAFKEWNPTQLLFNAANHRAAELGFGLDPVQVNQPGLDAGRIDTILRTRHIGGAIIAPLLDPGPLPEFPWEAYPAVHIGRSLTTPAVHYVAQDFHHAIGRVLAELEARGYRRLGFLGQSSMEERRERIPLLHFKARRPDLPATRWIAPEVRSNWTPEETDAWLSQHRPDAVIIESAALFPIILATGRKIPEDLGVVTLSWWPMHPDCAGIRNSFEAIGAAAVDVLTAHIHRNERGLPRFVKSLQVDGDWVEGNSLVSNK